MLFGTIVICIPILHNVDFFFFNDTATTEIYTLSLHDALPISEAPRCPRCPSTLLRTRQCQRPSRNPRAQDRKSTRLNSSHTVISYAVFCLKKKKTTNELFYIIQEWHHNHYLPINSYVVTTT